MTKFSIFFFLCCPPYRRNFASFLIFSLLITKYKVFGTINKFTLSRKSNAHLSFENLKNQHPQKAYKKINSFARSLGFWKRSFEIYASYKLMQLQDMALQGFLAPFGCSEDVETMWNRIHEQNSDKMLSICLDLGGFYLKFGQFLGTRHDFMPKAYTRKLSQLQDSVPPISAEEAQQVIEAETGQKLHELFQSIDLSSPVGSASIAQVHEARLFSGQKVAVKVQYPGAERIMLADLANLRKACVYLTAFELKFDLKSPVLELQKQLTHEFDFLREAKNMDQIGKKLQDVFGSSLVVPSSINATKRMLVMTFVEGIPISRLQEEMQKKKLSSKMRRKLCEKILSTLADSWGHMIFEQGIFNADPHPGNILIQPGLRVGLLDWGQTKTLKKQTQIQFARLVQAMAHQLKNDTAQSLFDLGIHLEHPEDLVSSQFIAGSMFDTRKIPGYSANPFSEDNALRTNAVKTFPPDLFFLLRSIQMLRGLAHAMDVDFHLSKKWEPFTKTLLEKLP